MNGIFVAMMVTNCTFDSSGRFDMNSTCWPTWFTSMRGSCIICPCGCICPAVERAVSGKPTPAEVVSQRDAAKHPFSP